MASVTGAERQRSADPLPEKIPEQPERYAAAPIHLRRIRTSTMKLTLRDAHAPDAPARRLQVEQRDTRVEVRLEGRLYLIEQATLRDGVLSGVLDGQPFRLVTSLQPPPAGARPGTPSTRHLSQGGRRVAFLMEKGDGTKARARTDAHEPSALTSSMPGQVLKVLVNAGDEVQKHQSLLIIEAMKMEHEVKAPFHGRVKHVACRAGSMVSPGVPLVEIEPLVSEA